MGADVCQNQDQTVILYVVQQKDIASYVALSVVFKIAGKLMIPIFRFQCIT